MGRILMRPLHLANLYRPRNSIDATPPQGSQLGCKAYLFKPLPCILKVDHTPVVRAAQRGRDWRFVQTHLGDRSRSRQCRNSSKLSQHSVFWPSWQPVTKAGQSKITWHPSPLCPRSRLNPSLRANITDDGAGRGANPALAPVAPSQFALVRRAN